MEGARCRDEGLMGSRLGERVRGSGEGLEGFGSWWMVGLRRDLERFMVFG